MNESALMIVLRLIHIFSGIFWAGSVALLVWFILPAQLVLGRGAMPFMQELMMRRRLRVYVTIAMIVTLLSGLAMYARLAMTTHGQWAGSTPGKVLGIGALAAIIAGGIGGSVGASTARKSTRRDAVGERADGRGVCGRRDRRGRRDRGSVRRRRSVRRG